MRKQVRPTVAFLASVSCFALSAASAQAAVPAPKSDIAALDEVVITAERRETSLQTTPAAVSSFDEKAIARFGTLDTRSLMGLVPNLYVGRVTTAPSTQTYGMRGLSQSDTIADPTVGVYVDDVYLPRSIGAMMSMPDLQRIEVLRGPQGTLYGRNASAGAIKFITADPKPEFEARLGAEAGNIGTLNASAFVSGPLVGSTVLGSLAVYHTETSGYTDAPNIGRKVNRLNQDLVRAKLVYRPTDALTVKLSADAFLDTSDAAIYVAKTPPAGATHDPYVSYERDALGRGPALDLKEGGVSLDVAYELSPTLKLKSISALRGFRGPYLNSNDGLPQTLSETFANYDEGAQTQELQVQGDYGRLSFTAGLYYFHEAFKTDTLSLSRLSSGITPADAVARQITNSYSGYLQGDYDLGHGLILIAGARYTEEERDFSVANYQAPAPAFRPTTVNYAIEHAKSRYNAFSPRIGLQYQARPWLMAYASYSEGFQAGGFSFRAASATVAQRPFAPQYVKTWEGGFRSELLDRRARLNVTAFRNDVTDLQLTAFVAALNVSTIVNAGSARTQGVEVEASAVLAQGFTVTANASYLEAEYLRFDNPRGPGTSGVGLHPIFAPEWTLGATANYVIELEGRGSINLTGDLRYQTKTYLDVLNTPGSVSPAQTFVNVSSSYRTPDAHWSVGVSIKNLLDKAYAQFSFNIPTQGVFGQTFNAPRTYLVFLKYQY